MNVFRIKLSPDKGACEVEMDGRDLLHGEDRMAIQSVDVHHSVDYPIPIVVLHVLASEIDLEVDGELRVEGEYEGDVRDQMVALLNDLDPAIVESKSLERGGLMGSPAASMIDVIKDMISA